MKNVQSILAWTSCVFLLWCCITADCATNDIDRAMIMDSDGDGMTDWQEWQAGTNPGDSNSCFRVTGAITGDAKYILFWPSVNNRTYEVVTAQTLQGLLNNPLRFRVVATSTSSGPWQETVSVWTNQSPSNCQFFRVACLEEQKFDESVMDLATFE